jgi:DNA polymerase-3 subunit delta
MAQIKRKELQNLLEKKEFKPGAQVYLFFGERFLCNQAADQLQTVLLQKNPGAVHTIDGEREDFSQTLARLVSFSLLPGLQIYRVADSRIFHTKTVLSTIWDKAVQAHEAGRLKVAERHLQSVLQAADMNAEGTTPLSEIHATQWKAKFGFEKPSYSIDWADRLINQSTAAAPASSSTNLVDKCIETFDKGLPDLNILILTTETVDKRQRLFTYLKKNCTVIDCSVTAGAGAAAQKEQKEVLREVMLKTLKDFGKKIDPRAADMFFERVGFHPVAVVVETEKLALYAADRDIITCDDLLTMVGHSREDALFELTDAFSKRQTGRSLTILARLQEQGIHGLAILATMRNFIKKLLIFKSLQIQATPAWRKSMNANEFQNSYLPQLKKAGEWEELLKGHPYALFMSFSKASDYSTGGLKSWLELLFQAEFRLKGSPLPVPLVLEELFLTMLHKS